MSRWEIPIIFIVLIVVAFLLGFYCRTIFVGSSIGISGDVVQENEEYSWTRAICNEGNECLDIVVSCDNGRVKEISPITEIIYQSVEWKDPRNESKFC